MIHKVILIVALAALTCAGCTDESSVVRSGGSDEPDAGADAGPEADAGDDASGEATGPSKPGSQLCAAAGTAEGDGVVVQSCFGPVEQAAPVLHGEGYRLQAGGFQAIAPK
ncbi:MAG: hypothetical protein ACLFVJ_15600 [Persicimonas sp.]